MDNHKYTFLIMLGIAFVACIGMGLYSLRISELNTQIEHHKDSTTQVIDSLEFENDSLKDLITLTDSLGIPTWARAGVVEASKAEGVPLPLAARLVAVESGWRPRAVSSVGAVGLTQILPSTARIYDANIRREDLFDVERNLHLGFRYLRDMYDLYGDWYTALRAYNAGPARIQYDERISHNYAERVLGR